MRSVLVYDLATRLFHWLFSALFLLSFIIAKTVDDESIVFSYHMLSGLLLGGLVVWRIIWGFCGSQHARFSGFSLKPSDLKNYFSGIFSGSAKRWIGHNPASSWAAIIMLVLGLSLSVTGILMSTGYKEQFEEVHEFMANAFVVVVVLHVAGLILHHFRHQDKLALSMIDGRKATAEMVTAIPSSRRISAVFLLALFASSTIFLVNNFEQKSRTLNAFGWSFQLGENEGTENESEHEEDGHEEDGHD